MPYSDVPSDIEIPSSFEVFYREEFGPVLALVYALTGSRWVAEDLAQEAFLRVHRDWNRVSGMDSPSGWVRRIAVNLAKSFGRRLRSEAFALLRLGVEPVSLDRLPEEFEDFWREVRKLPKRQAHAISLRYIDDMSVSEIALVMGIAEGTVKAQLHDGRLRLRRQLEAKGLAHEV